MGCSPSKGKLFSKPNGSALENGQLEEASQNCVDSGPVEEVKYCSKVEDKSEPLPPSKEYAPDQDQSQMVADTETKVKEKEVDMIAPEKVTEVSQTDEVKTTQRRQKNKNKQRCIEKLRKSSVTKVDFPPHMVRAHQAAYAFLNPNIYKFETLLGLLDQAAHTQLSLQPMMSALVLRFEEINQALEEMAEEGELMLKEHGDYMALPSGMMGPAVISALKSSNNKDSPPDPPPDLLQQLLQHSTEKMRHVGGSFQAVGDTTLEEAVEYFTSLSKLLVEKMKAKHNAELRIAQVLAQVEVAAMRKFKPEDSALHSEDSGIGGENDSLTGSDRQRRHRGSAGSGSSASGASVRAALLNNAPYMADPNEHNEEEEEEEEDDDIDEEDDDLPVRKRSNSSPPGLSQTCLCMHEMISKVHRPHTAAVASEPEALLLLQNNEQMKTNSNIRGKHQTRMDMTGIRRHSISGSGLNKRLSKTNQVCTLPTLASQPPKPPSVRRLINSFSRPDQSWDNLPTHIRRPRKTTLPLSNTAICTERTPVSVSWPYEREDPDEDNLPPPPPEVLLDNSFQGTENISGNEKAYQDTEGLPMNKRRGLSQRLRTVELLPNRASVKPRSLKVSSAHPVRQNAIVGVQEEGRRQEAALDPDSSLYQQARTIIHIRSAVGPPKQPPQRSDSTDICEGDMSCSLPVIAPPVSRVRLPPSCPSVRHQFPSPPMVRPQSSSSRPSSPNKVTRAMDNQVEEIVPSVSFNDARSVFCQNEAPPSQPWTSSGTSVLPRPWGEGSRGRPGTRGMDSTRRTQSEHRPTITIRTGVSKRDNIPAATGH